MEKNIFELKTRQLKEIAEDLQRKIEAGLNENHQEIECFPTYINPKKEIKNGKTLVLDLGGTNFRVAVVEFINGKPVIYPENGLEKNLSKDMQSEGFSREQLFEKMADLISSLDLKGVTDIGYCFSYPTESLLKGKGDDFNDGDARLIRWTKGIKVEGMIGEVVGQPLMAFLNNHEKLKLKHAGFKSIKVINDTVASLFAGLTKPAYDAYIGLIVGTGTNMAAFVQSNKIKKLNPKFKESGLVPVNLESGNFHPPYLTVIDDVVNAQSDARGGQRFEKAVSGFYLGKILKYTFPHDEFEDDFDARKLTRMMNYPDIHKDKYVRASRWIYVRSAQLVAASLAGLILVLTSYDKSVKRICLTAEGSLFWSDDLKKGKDYNKLVLEELNNLLAAFGLNDVYVDINRMDNANLIGSATAALS